MKTKHESCTFSAESSSAETATRYIADDIMQYEHSNNCSVVTISHAMIQQDGLFLVTAIAIFETLAE